jgi:hypothetical protein
MRIHLKNAYLSVLPRSNCAAVREPGDLACSTRILHLKKMKQMQLAVTKRKDLKQIKATNLDTNINMRKNTMQCYISFTVEIVKMRELY